MLHLYTADPHNSGPEITDGLSEDPARQTELGNQCDGLAHVVDEGKELRRVSGIEVALDQPRQITPLSVSPTTFSPQVETSSRKRKFQPATPTPSASQPVAKIELPDSGEDTRKRLREWARCSLGSRRELKRSIPPPPESPTVREVAYQWTRKVLTNPAFRFSGTRISRCH